MIAIIPAAGIGSRMQPASLATPKELLPIVDTPIIELVVREAVEYGVKEFYIVLTPDKVQVIKYLQKVFPSLAFTSVFQNESKYGLGQAVLECENLISSDFIVMLPDMLIDTTIKQPKFWKAKHYGVCSFYCMDVSQYGIVLRDTTNKNIIDIIEKPANYATVMSNEAIVGRYKFSPSIFDYLKQVSPNENDEICLTQAIKLAMNDGVEIKPYVVIGEVYDCGSIEGYAKAFIDFSMQHEGIGDSIVEFIYD